MAKSIFKSDYQSKAFHVLGLFCLMLLMIQKGYAREFQLNWGLHNGTYAKNYNEWAERSRFQIGDAIVFNYAPNDDSVLQVTADAYKNCNVESPISKYTDGHTVFSFNHSGPYYFISGNREHCEKNEKVVVVVLADRSNPPTPPPSGSIDIMPAPAPYGESPPAGTEGNNPTQAPSEESNPPNAANSVFVSVAAWIGAIVASALVSAF